MTPSGRSDAAQRTLVQVTVAVAVVAALVLAWYAVDLVLLAFIGVLLALLLRAPADWLSEHTRIRPAWALGIIVALLLLVLSAAAWGFGHSLLREAAQLADRIPEILQTVRERLEKTELGSRLMEQAAASGLLSGGEMRFIGRGLGLIGATFGALANILIVIFFAIFLAAQPGLYVGGLLDLVAPAKRERAAEVLQEIAHVLRRWLVGQSLLALIVALLSGIGLALLGSPFALSLALLAGLMEFVPYIGPLVAAVPAILIGFAEGPELAAWIALLYLGIQVTESYILSPLVQHRAVYLPPALVLFAQVLMGVMVGGLGVAVATPLAAALMVATRRLYVEDVLGYDADAGA